jgi:TonB family protein
MLLLVAVMPLSAQGWRQGKSGGLTPQPYLGVTSREQNARLTAWCQEDGLPDVLVEMPQRAGHIFRSYSQYDLVIMSMRFPPDTSIIGTTWRSHIGSGEANVAHVDARESREPMLSRLSAAHVVEMELPIYGGGDEVATFRIPNPEAFQHFVAACHEKYPNPEHPTTGNEVFMEAIVEEKPAVLSGPTLQFPELLRQAGIEGRVLVQAIVDTLGRAEPNSVKVLQSPNPGFDQSATNYVLKALFRPARVHGRAVRVLIQIPVDFQKH